MEIQVSKPPITEMANLPLETRLKLCILSFLAHLGRINPRVLTLVDIKTAAPATKLINTITISTSDIPIDPSRNLWFRLFTPNLSHAPLPIIVYFHGGGFSSYGPHSKTFNHLCTHLAAKTPAVVASINYRLAPNHKYPSQYDDGFDALKFIDAKRRAILPANVDLTKCFIGGDSAGGNIAHHVTIRALKNCDQFDELRLAGVVEIQPFYGGEERTESEMRLTKAPMINVKRTDLMWRDFLPDGEDRNHPAVNVWGGGDAEMKSLDFPRSLVILGGNDPLQDWQKRYGEWLNKCGKDVETIEYANAFHGFYGFPEMPEFALLIDNMADFVRKHTNVS